MNQYILHTLTNYSIDEERLKVLNHTPYLFKNFYRLLTTIVEGGFMFLKGDRSNLNMDAILFVACYNNHITIVNLLIELGFINNLSLEFHGACNKGHLDIVKLLIGKGCYGRREIELGLYYACKEGHFEISELLFNLVEGHDFWCNDDWLGNACQGGHLEIVKLLTERGNLEGDNLDWGLHYACRNGHVNVIKYLIEKGATRCSYCHKSLEEHLRKSILNPK